MVTNTQNGDDLRALNTITQAAKELGLDVVRLDATSPTKDALKLVDEKVAREFRLLPVRVEGNTAMIALADPSLLSKPAPAFLQELKKKQGYQLRLLLTPPKDLDEALNAYRGEVRTVSATDKSKQTPSQPATQSGQSDAPTKPEMASPARAVQPAVSPTPTVPASVRSQDVPSVDLTEQSISREVIERFPEEVARKYKMVVFRLSPDGKEASVAAVSPNDSRIKDILKFVEERNGVRVRLFRTSARSLETAMAAYRHPSTTPSSSAQDHSIQPAKAISGEPFSAVSRAKLDEVRAQSKQPKQPIQSQASKSSIASTESQKFQNASEYQQVATTPKRPKAQSAIAPQAEQVATVKIGELETQAGLAAPSRPQTEADATAEGQDLDAILGSSISDVQTFERTVKSGLIPKIVAAIVSYAAGLAASDIHLEAAEQYVRVRYRLDGQLRDIVRLPTELHAPLISRIKILAKLKIDETRLPQDGRFDVMVGGKAIDLRVSTLPTVHGEKVVLRLLDKSGGVKELEDLGMSGIGLNRVTRALKNPYGISLVTGPTGSGKSTTLYAMLGILNRQEVNIITLEDPVEYQVEGINQTQVKPKIGLTFADGLRSILRQDPDIIMVGEIRDGETAALATQAALTGHLVLSTLHTNDAAGAIPRLIDMKVEPFLIASSLDVVIAQRLVRRLCDQCKKPAEIPAPTRDEIQKTLVDSVVPAVKQAVEGELKFWMAEGCDQCQSGYKGRIAIYEVLEMSDAIAELTTKKASADDIDEQARKEGMVTLKQDGILKALKGITTVDEVLQATAE